MYISICTFRVLSHKKTLALFVQKNHKKQKKYKLTIKKSSIH